MAELGGDDVADAHKAEQVKRVVQSVVEILAEATQIVGFFKKWDEQKRIKVSIKRLIIKEFDDEPLAKALTERFMDLAEVKFK